MFYSQNVAGLSAQSREESINLMEKYDVTVTCLQETWTGTTQKDSEFEDRRNGFLFLLKGNEKPTNQRGRNRCGIGFILSPLARKAWMNAGQHPVKQHPTPDGMARIASIKLTFNLDKPSQKNFFICTAYAPDSSYEKSFPYEVFIASLTDAVKECPKDHILVLGTDTNCRLGNCNSTPPLETEEGEGKNYPTIGKYNLPQLNERGNMLRQFLSMNELCATNTFFIKNSYATKHCTINNNFYTTDFIISKQVNRKLIRDAGVSKNGINSDHRAIYAKFYISKLRRRNTRRSDPIPTAPKPKVNWLNLRDADKANNFNDEVASAFNSNQTYTNLAASINTAAEIILTDTRPHDPPWFKLSATTLTPLITARNSSQKRYFIRPSPASKATFVTARSAVKKAVTIAKLKWLEIQAKK